MNRIDYISLLNVQNCQWMIITNSGIIILKMLLNESFSSNLQVEYLSHCMRTRDCMNFIKYRCRDYDMSSNFGCYENEIT